MSHAGRLQDKWAEAGWRIEQKYSNKVLIGNWAEERLQFTREPKAASSSNRVDYQPHWELKPDVCGRGCAPLRAEGLSSKQLFGQYFPPPSHYLISHYEESYGSKRANTLPTLRTRSDSFTGPPDGSGGPISDPPDMVGVQQSRLPSLTAYGSAYQRHPHSALCGSRFARASRKLSSHLHAANHNNKDLNLRRRSLLQVPDLCGAPR